MISPELAHRAGRGEELIYKLVHAGWIFQEDVFLDKHKNTDVVLIKFKSPKMKTFSVLVEQEWYNITKRHLLKREKESL